MSDHDKDDNRTPEEIEIDKIIAEANERVQQINNQLNNNPPDKPYTYDYHVPGGSSSRPFGTKTARENALKEQLSQIKTETRDKLQDVIKDQPLDRQLKAYPKIHAWSYPEQNEPGKFEQQRTKEKDITESGDVAMKLRSDRAASSQPSTLTPPKLSITPHYDGLQGKGDTTPEKTAKDRPNKDVDKDITDD